jgi:hypothetical protein
MPDDRQHGGSGAGSTVCEELECCRCIPLLKTALEAAQQIAYLPCDWNHCIGECQCRRDAGRPTTYQAAYEQSRATEAELRDKVERRDAVVQAYRPLGAMLYGFGWSTKVPAERLVLEAMKHVHTALVALDAAEQPARAEGGQG